MITLLFCFIPCRSTHKRLVFDEQSTPYIIYMCRLRVYRKNCGAAIDGQPQAHGIEECPHRVQPFPSTIQFLVVLRGKRRYIAFKQTC